MVCVTATDEDYLEFASVVALVSGAHDELLRRLFGEVPKDVRSLVVSRERYTEVMKDIQKEYGLGEGSPNHMLFVFEQLSRAPKFKEDENQ